MIIARTPPFLRAPEDSVRPTPWRAVAHGEDRLLGEVLPEWDAGTDLHLIRSVEVDTSAVLTACNLPSDSVLRLGVAWHATGTTLRGRGTVQTLPMTEETRVPLSLDVRGVELGGTLRLRCVLALGGRVAPAPLRARRAGSVLWEDVHEVVLEGGGARFPMEALSFKDSSWRLPDHAAWALEWDRDDLELPLLGALRLYLNTDHPTMAEALNAPDAASSRLLMAALQHDVGRQLVLGALMSDAFVSREDKWPRDSVGEVVSRLIAHRFRGESATSLRQRLEQEPLQFEAVLQDRLRLFGGPES